MPLGAVSVAVEIVAPAPAPAAAAPNARHARPVGRPGAARDAVRHVIAVGAGKGGVGKSTVAVNLALALAREGLRAALLDADIYGPSLPDPARHRGRRVAGADVAREAHPCLLEAHGLPMISFGFFLGEGSPAIWRGPMVSKAVKQFARGVAWPELDVLIVDLPPGTGDIPLSLAQSVELSGAVIVTQPPRVAVAEARKAVEMFRTLEVPRARRGREHDRTVRRGAGQHGRRGVRRALPRRGPVRRADGRRRATQGRPPWSPAPRAPQGARSTHIARGVADALGWRHVETGADAVTAAAVPVTAGA